MSLSMVNEGEGCIVSEVRGKDSVKKHLFNLGLIKGEPIQVIQNNENGLVLSVKGVRIALNRGIASLVMVN